VDGGADKWHVHAAHGDGGVFFRDASTICTLDILLK